MALSYSPSSLPSACRWQCSLVESPSGTQANKLGVFSQHQKVTHVAALYQMGFKNQEKEAAEEANGIIHTNKN